MLEKQGSVSVIASISIFLIIAICAFSIDLSSLYTSKLKLQRVTDLAAFAGIARPNAVKDEEISSEALATIRSVLTLNNVDDNTMQASIESKTNGEDILVVSTNNNVPLLFGHLLSSQGSYQVGAVSGVLIGAGQRSGECLRSLIGPINIYGSADVVGPGCKVGAASYLHLCGAAKLEVEQISVKVSEGAERAQICAGTNLAPPLSAFAYNITSQDPYASDPRIKAIRKRFDQMRSPGWPYGSVSPGVAINRTAPASMNNIRANNQTLTRPASIAYGSLQANSSILTFQSSGSDPDCSRPTTFANPVILVGRTTLRLEQGCYVFASSFTIADGAKVDVVTDNHVPAQHDAVTLVFNGSIENSGSIQFGTARVFIKGSISNTKGRLISFGAGEFILNGGSISNGAGRFEKGDGTLYFKGGSVSNGTGLMTFGNGTLYLWGGSFSNASTGQVLFGDGPFIFYGGTLTNVSGDMTFGRGPFEFYGGSLSLNRDSQTTFGVGNMNFYGGSISFGGKKVVFGKGGDAITGGSSVFVSGGSLSLPASSIEAIGTTIAFDGGTISLYGAGNINTTAPTGNMPAFGYRDVLFAVYGGAFNLYGASSKSSIMSGLIYVPQSNASLYGQRIVERPEGGCLQLLAGVVDIYQNMQLDMAACTEDRDKVGRKPVLVR